MESNKMEWNNKVLNLYFVLLLLPAMLYYTKVRLASQQPKNYNYGWAMALEWTDPNREEIKKKMVIINISFFRKFFIKKNNRNKKNDLPTS